MILFLYPRRLFAQSFPRTRGDDPEGFLFSRCRRVLFPAHAGMILGRVKNWARRGTFPRTRGDDPDRQQLKVESTNFSPHTRG